MGVYPVASGRPLLVGVGVAAVGVLAALATDIAVSALSPAKFAFALGGFALLIPTIVLKNPKTYWLFLLVLSIPFDISKWLSIGMVDSQALVDTYGMPMSGTVGLEIYVTDVILVAMLLPWLARVCLRRETFYFPKIGYLFVSYLAWALLVSLINAESLWLAMFELFRQALYFLSFVYLVNNVSTRREFRSVVWAVCLGLIISAGTVIVFFEKGIGSETVAFASLHDEPAPTGEASLSHPKKDSAGSELTLTLGHGLGGKGSAIKRSQGMFRHPAIAAGLCALLLPTILAFLVTAQSNIRRGLFLLVYLSGLLALVLTFSRAALIGFGASWIVFFVVGGWSGLLSRRVLKIGVIALTSIAALSTPLLLFYLGTRPESFSMRFNMFEAAIQGYFQHPILGVGLNNSTAAMKEPRQELREMGIQVGTTESADSYYLAILTEIGPVGSLFFFGFFAQILMIALRSMREVAVDMKMLLVGMVTGLAAVATQSIADGPLAGHAVSGMLWLFAALIVAIRRHRSAEETQSAMAAPRVKATLIPA